jgi:hypothetical protein
MPETQNETPLPEEDRGALTPLNIIRTETVLSKLPIHNLAKKGRVNIQITKQNGHGEIELLWEVSYSDRYGQPRQLAYKLDSLVVNRRIDEEKRPLPKIIRLGSLRKICKDLNLEGSGDSINRLKKAFRQNAFAGITAKLKYKGKDGTEKYVDASDTRYGVVFTGEKLPDGTKAEAVYITLHNFYWEVLNNAPIRPLNYDYLQQLSPAPQRFYEIISYRIFAALKYNHPHAKLLYSEYCLQAPQTRYYDYDHFKKQMYKDHRPHFLSGYIEKGVHYIETTDSEGKIDWEMQYVPGPRAKAEYKSFTRRPQAIDIKVEPIAVEKVTGRGGEKAEAKPAPELPDDPLVSRLVKLGVLKRKAHELLQNLKPGQQAQDQIEYYEHVKRTANDPAKITPGLLITLIEQNDQITETAGFVPSRIRKQNGEQEKERKRRQDEADRAQENLENEVRRRAQQRYDQLSDGEYEDLAAQAQAKIKSLPFGNRYVPNSPEYINALQSYMLRALRLQEWEKIKAEQGSTPAAQQAAPPTPNPQPAQPTTAPAAPATPPLTINVWSEPAAESPRSQPTIEPTPHAQAAAAAAGEGSGKKPGTPSASADPNPKIDPHLL